MSHAPLRSAAIVALLGFCMPTVARAQAQRDPVPSGMRYTRVPGEPRTSADPRSGNGVFHERIVVEPMGAWARRGAAVAAAGAAMLQTMADRPQVTLSVKGSTSATMLSARGVLTGTMRQAVVLVTFADDSLGSDPRTNGTFAASESAMMDAYYGTGGGRPAWTTVSQYYRAVSGGRFDVQGEVVARIRMPRSQAYYVIGDARNGSSRSMVNWSEFLRTAVPLIDAQLSEAVAARFTEQGRIGTVFGPIAFFHPGADGACGATSNIWAHRSVFPSSNSFTGAYPRIKGRAPSDYIVQGTRCFESASEPLLGPAILIHETGHLIGLPDLYSSGTYAGGVGTWDVMSGYSSTNSPSALGAFSRVVLGWAAVKEVELASGAAVAVQLSPNRLQASGSRDTVLAMRYGSSSDELLLVEHRTKQGVDQTVHESGPLLWYVNAARAHPSGFVPGGYAAGSQVLMLPVNNSNPVAPVVIVVPQNAAWRVAKDGKPLIDVSLGVAQQNQALTRDVTWGRSGRRRAFTPDLVDSMPAPVWRSFVTGAPGNVLEQITWNGDDTSPGSYSLRSSSLLDVATPVTPIVVPTDTVRPLAGAAWTGATVRTSLAVTPGVTYTWRVADSSGVHGIVVTPSGNGVSALVRGTLSATANASAGLRLELERRDASQVRRDTVAVPVSAVIARPYTRLQEAKAAYLRGAIVGDAALFVDRMGNGNGRVDIGDLYLLRQRGVLP